MYKIRVVRSTEKQLKKLSIDIRQIILEKIFALEKQPRPKDIIKLYGWEHTYRLRIGNYRVIYEIYDKEKTIVILKCMHRREIYR